mmetsp:Transcript_18174/g.41719  ORF Transcript_18174/g.41719 Transcript_18174/m.41719 type:complete len:401 (+) Transcript_18174:222-1424(+)
MPKFKKEKKSSSADGSGPKYPVGTKLAIDLYGHGNFFEAVIQNASDLNMMGVVRVQYFDKHGTVGTIDLNQTPTVELVEDNILTLEDVKERKLSDEEKGFLGRRLTVQWEDNQKYSGMITKILKSEKNFVFISYDDGDKVWYNLMPEKENSPSASRKKSNNKSASSKSASARVKSEDEEGSSFTSRKSNGARKVPQLDPKFEKARRELENKYPIGCTIAVDSYHDEHYHEAVVIKYIPNPTKAQQTKGEQWVYLHWLDQEKTKNWVDLNCINAIKIVPDEILRLDQVKSGQDRGFLGQRIVVQWKDGNKYCGLATKCTKDNKHFVFLEYDDGDQCWCDLQRESYWSIDGEEDDEDDHDTSSSSDESSDDGGRSRKQRKRKATSQGHYKKRTRATEISYDF